jgi:hypothetical protein
MSTFNAADGDTIRGADPLPKAVYPMNIIGSDVKGTKDSSGSYVEFIFEVSDGPHAKRRVYYNITFSNRNQDAVNIGHRELRTLCQAVGVLNIDVQVGGNLLNLHGQFFWGAVGFEKQSAEDKAQGYSQKNDMRNYHAAADYHLMPDGSVMKAGAVPGHHPPATKTWAPTAGATPAAPAAATRPATTPGKWAPAAKNEAPPPAQTPPAPDPVQTIAASQEQPAAPETPSAAGAGGKASWDQ